MTVIFHLNRDVISAFQAQRAKQLSRLAGTPIQVAIRYNFSAGGHDERGPIRMACSVDRRMLQSIVHRQKYLALISTIALLREFPYAIKSSDSEGQRARAQERIQTVARVGSCGRVSPYCFLMDRVCGTVYSSRPMSPFSTP